MAEEYPSEVVELGYVFSAEPDGEAMGYRQLDLFLVDSANANGFAPEKVEFRGVGEDGAVAHYELTPQGSEIAELRVAPGLVTVNANGGIQVDVYCFGGMFHVRRHPTHTHCRLTSPAPILNLSEAAGSPGENASILLVDELESEIAILRAGASDSRDDLTARLARVDPRQLYAAGLTLARDTFRQMPELMRTEHYWDEYGVITRAIEAAHQASWWPQDASLAAIIPEV